MRNLAPISLLALLACHTGSSNAIAGAVVAEAGAKPSVPDAAKP